MEQWDWEHLVLGAVLQQQVYQLRTLSAIIDSLSCSCAVVVHSGTSVLTARFGFLLVPPYRPLDNNAGPIDVIIITICVVHNTVLYCI